MSTEDRKTHERDSFKYDVAFSFVKDDEALASQLNDRLAGRLRTFLYSKEQENLAGRDGEEQFNKVFGADARIVVVIYRSTWGTTPWTRIEQTAIRNRAYDHGYGFTLFIPPDNGSAVPPWLPKTQLWLNLERYGLDGAASLIERLVEEKGGHARQETTLDKAARLAREIAVEQERQSLRQSAAGVTAATEEAQRLFGGLDQLANSAEHGLKFVVNADGRGRALYLGGYSMSCVWANSVINSIDDARIIAKLWRGAVDYGGKYYIEAHELGVRKFQPDFNASKDVMWHEEKGGISLSTPSTHGRMRDVADGSSSSVA